jgi:hypothetical protein
MTTDTGGLIRTATHITRSRLLRAATVAAILAVILAAGAGEHTANASANPTEAYNGEVSADEQLGLEKRHPGWLAQLSQTVTLSSAGDQLFGFDRYPEALASGECRAPADKGYLGFRQRGGKLRLLSRLDGLATAPVVGADREAAVVYKRNCEQHSALPYNQPLQRLKLLTGALGRRLTTVTALGSTAERGTATMAASPSGELAVAWLAPHGHLGIGLPEPTDLLHISIGQTSGSMSRPMLLGEHDVIPRVREDFFTHVRLAWSTRRELLVAYTVNNLVMLQTWRPGHGFDPPQTLGPVNPGGKIDLVIAVGPAGRAVVAWGTQRDIIEPESPWKVYAAVRTGARAHFGASQLVDPESKSRPAGPYLGGEADVTAFIGADGFTTVAWSSEERASAVRAVVVDPAGHFQPVQELAPASTGLTLTQAPGGGTLLQWEVPLGGLQVTLGRAARQAGDDGFGPAQAGTARLGFIDGAKVIDSATGG